MSEEAACRWPEQDAVDQWVEKWGIVPDSPAAVRELKEAVSAYRIKVQTDKDRRISELEAANEVLAYNLTDDVQRISELERELEEAKPVLEAARALWALAHGPMGEHSESDYSIAAYHIEQALGVYDAARAAAGEKKC